MIYWIQHGRRGPVKIGRTDDVAKRLETLQTGNPSTLRCIASVRGYRSLEQGLHRAFESERLSDTSEWFEMTEEIEAVAYIFACASRAGATPDTLPDVIAGVTL